MALVFNRERALVAATKYVRREQYDKAVQLYADVIKNHPEDIRSRLLLADSLVRTGDTKTAISHYLYLAKLYQERGELSKQIAIYRQVLSLHPNRLDVLRKLATMYQQLSRNSEEVSILERLAQLYLDSGQVADALASFRRIAELEPTSLDKRLRLAELYSHEGLTIEAVRQFSLACQQLLTEQRIDEYIRVAERLIYHKPDEIDVLRTLAQSYLQKNEPRRALIKLNALLRANPTDTAGLELLGETFLALGKGAKAVSVILELAREYQRKGEREAAVQVLHKALRWNSDKEQEINAFLTTLTATAEDSVVDEIAPEDMIEVEHSEPQAEPDALVLESEEDEAFEQDVVWKQMEGEEEVEDRPAQTLVQAPLWPNIDDELEELQFFMANGFAKDAEELLLQLQQKYPNHPHLQAFLSPAAEQTLPHASVEEQWIESLMMDETLDSQATPLPQQQVDDAQSHFDLGTAYQGMGLWDEAMAQFQLAEKHADWRAKALMMQAQVHRGLQQMDDAIHKLNESILWAKTGAEQSEGLYELGVIYEELGEIDSALQRFESVPAGYRDRDARISALRKQVKF